MAGVKGKSGGARQNSGRKSGITQKLISLKLDMELFEKLNGIKNRNAFINEAIREKIEKENLNLN